MADGQVIGKGQIDISADMSNFDDALAALPKKASSKLDAVMKALQARMAQTRLEFKVANAAGSIADIKRIGEEQDRLRAKMEAVSAAATRQAQAIQGAAAGNVAGSRVPLGPRDPRAVDLDKLGAAGLKAGKQIHEGGSNGAMGLMMLSQTIDDAQYGFRSIVNNIPTLTASMAQGLGMSSEAAYKLGGALGIAAVAVNTWVSHWDDVKAIFAGDWTHGASGVIRNITDALLTGAASLLNFDRGLGAIGLTTAQMHANQKGLADRAAQKAATEKAVEDAGGAVAGVKGEDADARGGLFREALAKYGGGEKLRNEMLAPAQAKAEEQARFRVKANPKLNLDMQEEIDKAKKKALDSVNLEIANALKGDADAIGRLAKGRPELPNVVDLKQQAIEQQGREAARAFAAKDRALTERLNAQGREEDPGMEKKVAERDAQAKRLGAALAPTLGQDLARPGGISDEDLDAKIKAKLRQAGVAADDIGKMVDTIRVNLKEEVENRINEKMLGGGISREQAASLVAREDREKARGLAGKPAQVQSDQAFYNSLLTASVTPRDDIPKEQLGVQKKIADGIQEVAGILGKQDKGQGVARAAPKGAK